MTETPWQVVGRFVKERRERLGLKQEELQLYGGPKVSTVGKIERAAQDGFPLRTQHAVENALGWPRGSIEELLQSASEPRFAENWEDEYQGTLVAENVPDLSTPRASSPARRAADLSDEELLAEVNYRLTRTRRELAEAQERLERAVATNDRFVAARLSVVDDSVPDEIAAHEEAESISGEQESPDTP